MPSTAANTVMFRNALRTPLRLELSFVRNMQAYLAVYHGNENLDQCDQIANVTLQLALPNLGGAIFFRSCCVSLHTDCSFANGMRYRHPAKDTHQLVSADRTNESTLCS
eukprot:SAG31_NODE_5303_length_2621_cov_1.705393_4_plen_109_part_00